MWIANYVYLVARSYTYTHIRTHARKHYSQFSLSCVSENLHLLPRHPSCVISKMYILLTRTRTSTHTLVHIYETL